MITRSMLTEITLVLALAFDAVPASAGPRTCGSNTMQYDSSGASAPTASRSRRA